MKTLLTAIAVIALGAAAFADTQHGIVKTRGRVDDSGVRIPGAPISGVIVKPAGRQPLLTDDNGKFSFPVTGTTYALTEVSKQGYVLVDPELLSRSFYVSPSSHIIVMENPSTMRSDRIATERRIRRVLQQRLHEREEELDRLRADSAITVENYISEMTKLQESMERNERIVSDMAARYASTDYDMVDEFHSMINMLILDGKLESADSLIATRGNLDTRITGYLAERHAIDNRSLQLDSARALAETNRRNIAADCMSRHDIFRLKHMNDSAGRYITLRADLDTTDIGWQLDAAQFLTLTAVNPQGSIDLYQRALRTVKREHQHDTVPEEPVILNSIGLALHTMRRHEEARPYFEKALSLFEILYGPECRQTAAVHGNLSNMYFEMSRYSLAFEHAEKSLEIWEKVEGPQGKNVAIALNNIAGLYTELRQPAKALQYYIRAVEIQGDSDEETTDAAITFNNMGLAYDNAGDYNMALEYYYRALKIWTDNFGEYHPLVATACNNIAFALYHSEKWEEGLVYHERAVESQRRGGSHDQRQLAAMLCNLGTMNYQLDHYDRAEECLAESVEIWRKLEKTPTANLAKALLNRAMNLSLIPKAVEAAECAMEALELAETLYGPTSHKTADCLRKVAGILENIGRPDDAIPYYRRAESIPAR